MKDEKNRGFLGFVLLREPVWDHEGFFARLKKNWGIVPESTDSKDSIFVFDFDGMHISAAFFPAPVPNGEAEQNAAFNFLWRGAAEEVSEHRAQVIISVLSGEDALNNALTLVRLCESCIDGNTIGIYTNGVVYEPRFYAQNAQMLHDGELPVFDLVWLGLTNDRNSLRGYTMGLEGFGKQEIEVLNCNDKPSAVLDFLYGIADYVIGGNVTLRDGETIGFTADQKLRITLSDGVEFDKPTLKIEYPK